jgi:O-antigen/teichoic acid export membrane protein
MLMPFLVNLVVVFLLSPVMVKALGNRDYGIWEVLLGVVGYLGVLDMGMGPALVRYVSHAKEREDQQALEQTLHTGLLALTFAGSVAFLGIALLPFLPKQVSPLPPTEARALAPLLLLLGGNLFLSFPNTGLGAYLLGLQKHRFVNLYIVATTIVEAVTAYLILVSDTPNKLMLLCLMKLLSSAIRSIVYVVWIAKTNVQVTPSFRLFRWPFCWQMVNFGLKNSLLFAAYTLIRSLILLVITHFVGVAAVVFFVIPSRLVEYAYAPADALGQPLFPFFTALAAKSDVAAARTVWLHTTRLLQVVTLGTTIAIVWLGEPFIRRWMGPEYATLGYMPLLILTVGLLMRGVAVNASRLLMSLACHGQIAVFTIMAAIGFVLLSAPLTHAAGIIGAALSVAMFMVTVGWWEIVSASRKLRISATKFILSTLTRFAAPCLVASLTFRLLLSYAYPATYPTIALHAILGGGVYLLIAFRFSLSVEDRRFLRGFTSTIQIGSAEAPGMYPN